MPKSSNFNLKELLSQRSLQQEERQEQRKEGLEGLTVDVFDLIPSEENFYNTEKIEELKQLIKAFGVLQPLLVKPEGEKYKVIAGHCRRLACMELVAEGKEQYRQVPCVKKTGIEEAENTEDSISKILNKLMLIAANKFREKTEWEKMEEVLQQEELVSELKKESNLPGRVRAMLSEITGVKEAQIGRYKAIKNNLCPELMEEFKADRIGMTIVYEASGLSADYQQMAFELFRENGILTGPDVKELKAQEEKEKQIPGQIKWPDNETTKQEAQEESKGQQAGDPLDNCMNPPEEAENERQEDDTEEEGETEEQQAEDPEDNKTTPEEDKQEPAKIVYVQQEATKQHGCGFCHPEHHREISSQQGNFLIAYDPETKLVQILSKETGSVETIIFHKCPMCGREL